MNHMSPEVQVAIELKQRLTTSSLSIKVACRILLVSGHVTYM